MTSIHPLVNNLDIKANWPEAVVAADHSAKRVFHPAIIEVAFAFGQRLDKLTHRAPCRRTKPLRTFPVNRNPLLAFHDITRMLDGILIFRHQIGIDCLSDGGDSYLVHLIKYI